MMRFVIEVPEGERVPTGYGVAWRMWERPSAVCMPLGFNYLAGAARGLVLHVRHGFRPYPFDARYAECYQRGIDEGIRRAVRDAGLGGPR